jgi:hypothetical protein
MREHDLFFYAERSPPTCTTRSTRRSLVPPSIIEHGLAFRVLTKAGTRAWCDHDLYRPDRDAFASTLTSLDERFSRKWERSAAPPSDRIDALKAFHERGIFTWVSLEPTLDVEASLAIVEATHAFVDLYKGWPRQLPAYDQDDRLAGLYAAHAGYPQPCRRPALHQEGFAAVPSTWLSESAACATAPLNSISLGFCTGLPDSLRTPAG